MDKKINAHYVKEIMQNTPRPHYLCGTAIYSAEGNRYKILTKANFKSEGNPSISDRLTSYMPLPHVNAADCLFGLWNAVHIIAELNGYRDRILKKIIVQPKRLIPPDTELELEAVVRKEKEFTSGGKIYSFGTIHGAYSLDEKELINITAEYYAMK